jgi:hypothetical protein
MAMVPREFIISELSLTITKVYIDGCEVFMAVKIHFEIFWVKTPHSLEGGYQHVGGSHGILFLP